MIDIGTALEAMDAAARLDLMTFTRGCFKELNPGQSLSGASYLRVMASAIGDSLTGAGPKRLIVNVPPRSLKSICGSVAATAWLLGKHPTRRIINVSYAQDLANKHARDTFNLMNTDFYKRTFPNFRFGARKAIDDFETAEQGFRMATSVGGVLTGRGGDVVILDDPLKPIDALSDTRREAVNSFFDNTLLSRLNDKEDGVIIAIMQRLHQQDLVGHLLKTSDKWKVLSFPAIAESEELMRVKTFYGEHVHRRSVGEALDPTRDSLSVLGEIKTNIGSYNFSAQYQQNPTPLSGNVVKRSWLVYYDPAGALPDFTTILQSWDTANKTAELNDFSVCTTWGLHNRKFYLLDVFRQRLEYPDLVKAVRAQVERHDPSIVLIEDKASGTQLIQQLRQEGLLQVQPHVPRPLTDKLMRLRSQTPLFEAGRVILPHTSEWLEVYTRELISFPGCAFDDQIDSTAQALDYMTVKDSARVMWERLSE